MEKKQNDDVFAMGDICDMPVAEPSAGLIIPSRETRQWLARLRARMLEPTDSSAGSSTESHNGSNEANNESDDDPMNQASNIGVAIDSNEQDSADDGSLDDDESMECDSTNELLGCIHFSS